MLTTTISETEGTLKYFRSSKNSKKRKKIYSQNKEKRMILKEPNSYENKIRKKQNKSK